METEADYIVQVPSADKRKKRYDIGAAYENKKGSITVYLNAYPLSNEILLIPTKKENE